MTTWIHPASPNHAPIGACAGRPIPHSAFPLPRFRPGFTLVELLIVIGIIGVLVAILVPVVSMMRVTGQSTDTAAMIRAIDAAARAYEADWKAYPGIFPEQVNGIAWVGPGTQPLDGNGNPIAVEPSSPVFVSDPDELRDLTGTENLVLSLLGGIVRNSSGDIVYDPAAVGRGPVALGRGNSRTYSAYADVREQDLSMHVAGDSDVAVAGLNSSEVGKQWGRFVEETGAARDSMVPEFVDRFSNPMPVLYMRANLRVPRVGTDNYAMAAFIADHPRPAFSLDQIIGYVDQQGLYSVGTGREGVDDAHVNAGTYHGLRVGEDTDDTNGLGDPSDVDILKKNGPFDAIPYLSDPSSADGQDANSLGDTPRKADSFVLISAGPDRVYGTRDDITNFGRVID